jgi:protein O-GlcNAc transferase
MAELKVNVTKEGVFFSFENFDEELKGLDEVLKVNTAQGESYLNKGEPDKAERYLNDAIENCSKIINIFAKKFEIDTQEFKDKLIFFAGKVNDLKNKIYGAYFQQGILHMKSDNWENSINAFKKVLFHKPNDYLIYNNLALCFKGMGDYDQSLNFFYKSVELNNHIDAIKEIADIYAFHKENYLKAIEFYEKYTGLNNKNAHIYERLAYTYQITGNIEKAVGYFKKAVDLNPSLLTYFLFYNLKVPEYTQENIFKLTKEYVNKYLDSIHFSPNETYVHQKGVRDKKLHIAYISGDFNNHAVSRYILPVLENHDKTKFTISCYTFSGHSDWITNRFKSLSDNFKDTNNLSNKEVAKLIYEDKIDILIDLSGHTPRSRVIALAYKPAPVQVSYLGYPNTTGLEAIDYFLTNNILSKMEDNQYFSEKLYFLNSVYCCFKYYFDLPKIAPSPVIKNGYITFGVYNGLSKINQVSIQVWSELLHKVPGSKLLISRKEAREDILLPKFEMHGISRNRLIFDNSFSFEKFNDIDIHLDTFPYTGSTVGFDSIFMGVPLITLYGNKFQGRVGSHINYTLGLPQLIAKDEKDYIEKAVSLANNIDELLSIKANLRNKINNSPFCDYKGFTEVIEAAYLQMWENFCLKSA